MVNMVLISTRKKRKRGKEEEARSAFQMTSRVWRAFLPPSLFSLSSEKRPQSDLFLKNQPAKSPSTYAPSQILIPSNLTPKSPLPTLISPHLSFCSQLPPCLPLPNPSESSASRSLTTPKRTRSSWSRLGNILSFGFVRLL